MSAKKKDEPKFTLVDDEKKPGVIFGELVQKLFKFRGMNQYQFAEKTGYSQSYISRVESGDRPFSKNLCQKFADALDVDASELNDIYFEISIGSAKPLDHYYKKLLGLEVFDDAVGSQIRQLQMDDLVQIFSPEAGGEFTFRGRTEDCEIDHFDSANVKPTSYDTRVGGYVEYDKDGNEQAVEVTEKVTVSPRQSMLVIVKEHITLPSCMEAEIHPASNIGQKHLIVSHGPVIDPGWSGYLRVSVFNPTDYAKEIRVDEPFLTLRFWITQR